MLSGRYRLIARIGVAAQGQNLKEEEWYVFAWRSGNELSGLGY
jgi:hypothetical protein